MRYNENVLLEGTWKDDQMKDGRGFIVIKNSGEYIGEIKEGKRHGKGVMLYGPIGGKKYNGTWVDGKRDGYGILTNGDTLVYEGTWVNDDERLGKGQIDFNNGKFTGNIKDSKPEGNGKMEYSNGDVFNGQWSGGVRNGAGVLSQKYVKG